MHRFILQINPVAGLSSGDETYCILPRNGRTFPGPPLEVEGLWITNDIWEVRVKYSGNIFRLLGFLDGNDLIILNHAFTKKTQKTPAKDIKKSEQRKKDYFSISQRRLT